MSTTLSSFTFQGWVVKGPQEMVDLLTRALLDQDPTLLKEQDGDGKRGYFTIFGRNGNGRSSAALQIRSAGCVYQILEGQTPEEGFATVLYGNQQRVVNGPARVALKLYDALERKDPTLLEGLQGYLTVSRRGMKGNSVQMSPRSAYQFLMSCAAED